MPIALFALVLSGHVVSALVLQWYGARPQPAQVREPMLVQLIQPGLTQIQPATAEMPVTQPAPRPVPAPTIEQTSHQASPEPKASDPPKQLPPLPEPARAPEFERAAPEPQPVAELAPAVPSPPAPEPVTRSAPADVAAPDAIPVQSAAQVVTPVAVAAQPPLASASVVSAPMASASGAEREAIPPRFDAAYLDNPKPIYPAVARRMGLQGRVLVRVLVNAEGRPETVELKQTSGSGVLDRAAADAVQRWRFVPARQGEDALAMWVVVPINFTLKER